MLSTVIIFSLFLPDGQGMEAAIPLCFALLVRAPGRASLCSMPVRHRPQAIGCEQLTGS